MFPTACKFWIWFDHKPGSTAIAPYGKYRLSKIFPIWSSESSDDGVLDTSEIPINTIVMMDISLQLR